MAFIEIQGLKGKVFVPNQQDKGIKKHSCADCFSCQKCSQDRCELCKGQSNCRQINASD